MARDGMNFPVVNTPRPLRSALVCFSNLRWNALFQRPQQLMSRFARQREVFFFEEPVRHEVARLQITPCPVTGVQVVTPMLPDPSDTAALRGALDLLLARSGPAAAWYCTPAALAFSDHVAWLAVAYDCVDGLPAEHEQALFQAADVVFTGGPSLQAARKHSHGNIHCLPSGVDDEHFAAARGLIREPEDQMGLRRPLLGYSGVIDGRLDMDLLGRMAALRPDWHFAMIGPLMTPLPEAANIHWLGEKAYAELPAYMSHWDAALMPYARNQATRLLNPEEAPEYLAAGRRVVSTPVADVVRRFAGIEAVTIAEDAEGFVAAAEEAMMRADISDFMDVDDYLATITWDSVYDHVAALFSAAERKAIAKFRRESFASPQVAARAVFPCGYWGD
ncbi:MAG: UDP-galactopyranose mutase [Rubritepida sp.]|nr:UDP-galactopyranose mutase [Rubritepida sp.]